MHIDGGQLTEHRVRVVGLVGYDNARMAANDALTEKFSYWCRQAICNLCLIKRKLCHKNNVTCVTVTNTVCNCICIVEI